MKHRIVLACALVAMATPSSSQTLLDRLISSIGKAGKPNSTAPVASAEAAAAGGSVVETAPAEFAHDVAGVRLGMSASAARAALTRAGYTRNGQADSEGPSWASRVAAKALERRKGGYVPAAMTDHVITKFEMVGANRERAVVSLAAVPTGSSVVVEVTIEASPDLVTGAAFMRQAVQRFGRPDGVIDMGLTADWCSPAYRSDCGRLADTSWRELPYIQAFTGLDSRSITLSEGLHAGRRRDHEFAAAVDRAAPMINHAAF